MSSWVLHCGSQHKNSGQSNTDFDLNLNQSLEFPDETKCTIFNVNIPNSLPNVCDAFENRTWKFLFRLYALPTLSTLGTGSNRTSNSFTVTTSTMDSALLHSEYELVVSIPEGNYKHSDQEANFTESTNVPAVAGLVRSPATINVDNSGYTDPVGPTVGPNNTNVRFGAAVPINDGRPWNTLLMSQLLNPTHRYGISPSIRNRTYAEALQNAIWDAQTALRLSIVNGSDNGGTVLSTFTDAAATGSAAAAANEIYMLRVIKLLISEMNITVMTNANHQLNFLVRSNFAINSDLASNIHFYLGNATFMSQFTTTGAFTVGTAGAGQVTTFKHVNPFGCSADGAGANNGSPSHFIQCKITAPANVRFAGRSVSNCLDYYNLRYSQTAAGDLGDNNVQLFAGDNHYKSTSGVPASAITENNGGPTDLANNILVANSGNFTPYGLTWTSSPITADRTDVFRSFVKQDGTDGWFGCAYFGPSHINPAAGLTFLLIHCYMYAPIYDGTNLFLGYINDVQCNRVTAANTITYPTTNARTVYPAAQEVYHNLVLYSRSVIAASGLRAEFLSGVFTGYTVLVSPACASTNSWYATGLGNLATNHFSIPSMDCESTPTFVLEIEMFGTGNHMKFTGSGECKRVKLLKRVSLNDLTYGGFITNNVDGQNTIDYGTCLGLSKVSSIKCRILNEKGEVIRLTHADSFPPWTFSLAFEC